MPGVRRRNNLIWLGLAAGVAVFVPWLLVRSAGEPLAWQGSPRQWLGVWLIANGAGLAGWCAALLRTQGRGTPLPFDPPTRFVAAGPYRFVRNPMMLGAFLVLGGEALAAGSAALGTYFVAYATAAHLFVTRWEERDLARRFGEPYRAYARHVPRWIPRVPSGTGKSA